MQAKRSETTMNPARQEIPGHRPNDAELAARTAAGDASAFRQIMRRHNQTMFRAARSILRDDAEAEDAVQEAYVLAWRSAGAFRGESKLSTWLVRIAVNEALARLRRRRRGAEVISLDGETADEIAAAETSMRRAGSDQPEREALRAETRRLIEAKLDELPEAFRSVFVLRAVEEMETEDVAACLGIPEATVRTRFFRARALLRESLSREIDVAQESAFGFAGERCDRIVARVMERIARITPGGS
jgi:RNA polymerase sigma-70 factor, ECF subfamily